MSYFLSILIGILKPISQCMFYIAGIFVAYKALRALNIYINKNDKFY